MELKLETLDTGVMEDLYVSVRLGEAQKISKLTNGRLYRFDKAALTKANHGKIEIFQRIGGCHIGIDPVANPLQNVKVPLPSLKQVDFNVALAATESPVKKQAVADKADARNKKLSDVKDYVERHNLEQKLSDAMKDVMRARPDDPLAFIADRLTKPTMGVVTKVPQRAAPQPAAAPEVRSLMPFKTYHATNFRRCEPSAWESVYAKFPGALRGAAPAKDFSPPQRKASPATAGASPGGGAEASAKAGGTQAVAAVLPFKAYYASNLASRGGAPPARGAKGKMAVATVLPFKDYYSANVAPQCAEKSWTGLYDLFPSANPKAAARPSATGTGGSATKVWGGLYAMFTK